MASFQSKLIYVSLLMLTGQGNSLKAKHWQNLLVYNAVSFPPKQKQKKKKNKFQEQFSFAIKIMKSTQETDVLFWQLPTLSYNSPPKLRPLLIT